MSGSVLMLLISSFEVKHGGSDGPISFQPKHTGHFSALGSPQSRDTAKAQGMEQTPRCPALCMPLKYPWPLYSPLVAFYISA